MICTLTGLALLCSGAAIPYGSAASLSLSVSAFAGVFGGGGAAAILALCLLLFSLSSLLSWGMYGLRCCGFLLGTRSARVYLLVYSLCAVLGAASVRSLVWELADLTNALMGSAEPDVSPAALRQSGKAYTGLFRSEAEGVDLAHFVEPERDDARKALISIVRAAAGSYTLRPPL